MPSTEHFYFNSVFEDSSTTLSASDCNTYYQPQQQQQQQQQFQYNNFETYMCEDYSSSDDNYKETPQNYQEQALSGDFYSHSTQNINNTFSGLSFEETYIDPLAPFFQPMTPQPQPQQLQTSASSSYQKQQGSVVSSPLGYTDYSGYTTQASHQSPNFHLVGGYYQNLDQPYNAPAPIVGTSSRNTRDRSSDETESLSSRSSDEHFTRYKRGGSSSSSNKRHQNVSEHHSISSLNHTSSGAIYPPTFGSVKLANALLSPIPISDTDYQDTYVRRPRRKNAELTEADKRFKCDFPGCTNSYTRNDRLRKHKFDKHSANKPVYRCNECGNKYTTDDDLKRHQFKHTDTFECPKCHARHDRKERLNTHMKRCKGKRNK